MFTVKDNNRVNYIITDRNPTRQTSQQRIRNLGTAVGS